MPENTPSPYPAWEKRFEANRDLLEREIEEWYKRNADRGSHVAAADPSPATAGSWLDRAGEEINVLFSDVKSKLQELFNLDDADDLTKQEHERAWQDDAHWQGRVRSAAEKLEQDGRFGK